MKFEKFFNSKYYKILELIYRLIITNLIALLSILLGLGIFSLMSALVSVIIIVKSINANTDFDIVKVYVRSFKKNYKKVFLLSLFYYLIIALAVFNAFYFYSAFTDYGTLFYEISYNVSLFVIVFVVTAFINACFVYVYFPNLTNKKIIKYSFTLFRVTLSKMLLIIIFIVLGFVLFYTIPILMVFFYFSLGLFLINHFIAPTYNKLVVDGVTPLNAFLYR